jgi:hypothetical protein
MRRSQTLWLILLGALLFSLIRAVIVHSAHVGPLEWLVVGLLVVVLVMALLHSLRRTSEQ